MISRFILLKLNQDVAVEPSRSLVGQATRGLLLSLPQVQAVELHVPADQECEDQWDLALIVQFESIEQVHAYLAEPRHETFVREYLTPRTAARRVWNFERL